MPSSPRILTAVLTALVCGSLVSTAPPRGGEATSAPLASLPALPAEAAGAAGAAGGAGAVRWIPPLGSLDVTGPYRAPPHRYGSGHRGVDLAAAPGTTVVAPASGTVSFAGTVVDRAVVSIRVDDRTVYSMEPVTSGLSQGEFVMGGAVLGEVSSGGHCLGECVHLGVRVDGEYVNPLRYFVSRPVLLPW